MSEPSPKPRPPLPPGPYLIVGLARSGQAAARLLAARDAEVTGCDSGSPEGAAALNEVGVDVHLGTDGVELLASAGSVVKSPGVPREAPAVARALGAGKPMVGELELAWRLLPNRFVAVTGTNGKTTVAELLGHLWRTAAEPVAVAGNVGTPLASIVDEVPAEATVVCECSSFQLEDAEAFAPECAVLLNLAPDHLDRHRSLDDYLSAKLRIFSNQGNDDLAVFNASEPALREVDLGGCARRLAYCRGPDPDCEVSLSDDGVIFADGEPLLEAAELGLPGPHNVDNAMAGAAAALGMGIDREAVAAGLRSFAGLPHRLERVAELGGVAYVNDSKATNVAAATAALRSFDAGVRAILGGSLKGGGFEGLVGPVSERCAACYLIGEAQDALDRALGPVREAGVELRRCDGLAAAVAASAADARPGEVVLLAPACASFDAYRDFEQRGEHFRALVAGLRGSRRREGSGAPGANKSGVAPLSPSRIGPRTRKRAGAQPIEYNLLLTATLCLLAFGVVMVFSASSTTALLGKGGDSAYYLKRTVVIGAIGLLVMRVMSARGLAILRPLTPLLLAGSFFLLLAVLLPGVGVSTNGASRWIGAGPLQVQPSELAKLSLVLYGAHLLAARPPMVRSIRTLVPYLSMVGLASLLMVAEPDLGTAIVLCIATAALLVAAGMRISQLALLAGAIGVVLLLAIAIEPYRTQRLTGFLNPSGDPSGAGFQAIQAKIALGSGGIFGVGLGQSLQKAFYLPEAHTDMIAAVIGEELGLAGISVLIGLFGMFGYAGLRAAQRARDRYAKLIAAGLTSLILIQAIVNLFAVLGLAPLTGVPLPFVSYGNSSLLVMLAATGLLLNVARGGSAAAPARRSSRAGRLRVVDGGRAARGGTAAARGRSVSRSAKGRHSRGRDSRARGARAGRRRRASG